MIRAGIDATAALIELVSKNAFRLISVFVFLIGRFDRRLANRDGIHRLVKLLQRPHCRYGPCGRRVEEASPRRLKPPTKKGLSVGGFSNPLF
jgi:hypothetical protein